MTRQIAELKQQSQRLQQLIGKPSQSTNLSVGQAASLAIFFVGQAASLPFALSVFQVFQCTEMASWQLALRVGHGVTLRAVTSR